ncbi:MAG: Ig-like domain-containing protein [Bacteroidales bacterium]|nr:Ig-like domain-containing protein [Bacteroidales bacterium]
MKKFLYSVMILSFAFAISCDKEPSTNSIETPYVPVTGVSLNHIAAIFNIGDTLTLIATVLPDSITNKTVSASNKTVSWISSAPNTVSVVNGKLTALAIGTATITVITQDGEKTATCLVTVSETIWETSLGKASFATDSTWKIPGNGITQEWSDAVQTVDCSSKATFSGWNSTTSSYNVDCRSNPYQKGDLFSWHAVAEVENICPDGWRIPDSADFRNLDIALGFNGQNRYQETVNDTSWQVQLDTYLTTWGGTYGGLCTSVGSLYNQDFSEVYWSQSENNTDLGFRFTFDTNGHIYPQGWGNKGYGRSLRCVRDVP